eukprot:6336235-Alexandrium_andersonii.AAC.1
MHPSGASGANVGAISGPAQFKLEHLEQCRVLQDQKAAESSKDIRGAPGTSKELGSGPLTLLKLL